MSIKRWFLLAFVLRWVAGCTHPGTSHPDEWYQTVEFANFIASGYISRTQEFVLHMRNLTWPAILAAWLSVSQQLLGDGVAIRMGAVKLATALADLGLLWGVYRLSGGRKGVLAVFVLAFILILESTRPSQEHLSAVALWVSLGLLTFPRERKWPHFLAGVFAVLTGAFRYPSGLFAVGLAFAVATQPRRFHRKGFATGLLAGAAIGGLADAAIYGRPWESFWMYFQYNILTGLSARNFGAQSVAVYWDYLKGAFGGPLAPVGLLAMICAPVGLARALRRREPWAWALGVYLAGHLWVAHKEPRFMAPILVAILWAAYEGASGWATRPFFGDIYARRGGRIAIRGFALTIIVANSLLLLRVLWGETWRANSNYLEIDMLLRDRPACAVISLHRPKSALLPRAREAGGFVVPSVAVGFFPAPRESSGAQARLHRPVIWVGSTPVCTHGQIVLFQPQRPEPYWEEQGCELLSAGILDWVPPPLWPRLVNRGWVSAPWYRCPLEILGAFPVQETRDVIGRELKRFDRLPAWGVSGEELVSQNPLVRDSTFGDW